MEKKKIPDNLIRQVVRKHSVSWGEAKKRMELLFQSGIMKTGNPMNLEMQHQIDDFLAQPSEALAAAVLLEKCVNECQANKEFVAQYCHLSGSKFQEVLDWDAKGLEHPLAKQETEKFINMVEHTVFARMMAEQF